MNLSGKEQHRKIVDIEESDGHHYSASQNSHHSFINDNLGGSGDLKQGETATRSAAPTSAADTLSMLTQSMLGTMPSAVATAAAAGLFMRVSGAGNAGVDGGSQGELNEIKVLKLKPSL